MQPQRPGASIPAWLTRLVELVRDYWALFAMIGSLLLGDSDACGESPDL